VDLPAAAILTMDSKAYTACGKKFAVSQVEVNTTEELIGRKAELLKALCEKRAQEGLYFAALMITDITALSSALLIDGDPEFLRRILFPRVENGVFLCRDILSRKKQLIPLLIEQMEAVLGVS
jgi:manganese-dependent inorganic pyrophosphatase